VSRDFHSTQLIGRLAQDPETKYAQNNGGAVTRLKVLVNEQWKDGDGREQKHVESYFVVCFNGLAEACGNYLSKGGRVFVRGRNRTRGYEKDGATKFVTELIADTVRFLDTTRDAGHQKSAPTDAEPSGPITDGDVPF
jgi:single-strand DNA-binding protein